jgi:hypothetical protein
MTGERKQYRPPTDSQRRHDTEATLTKFTHMTFFVQDVTFRISLTKIPDYIFVFLFFKCFGDSFFALICGLFNDAEVAWIILRLMLR